MDMRGFKGENKSTRRRWLVPLIFLLALVVRWERAWVTPVVNSDCLRFIVMAQSLPAHPIHTLRKDVYHPLQAVAGGAVYLAVFSHLMANQRMAWIAAMQAVGVVAGAFLAVEMFWLARRFGAPGWAAAAAAVLWIVGRKTSGYGADGISDMLFLSLLVGSILLAMQTGLRWHRWKWLVAGMIAGLSYLARPEGVAAVLIFWGALAIYHGWPLRRLLRWRLPQRRGPMCALACGLLMLLGFVLVGSPYMMAIGKFTGKKATVLNDLVATPPAAIVGSRPAAGADGAVGRTIPPQIAAFEPWRGGIWFKISQELAETLGWVPGIIMIGVLLAQPRVLGRRRWRGLVLAWAVLWLVVMIWLLSTAHYLANRHTLVLVFLLEALLALSLAQAAFLCAKVRREIGLEPSSSGGMYRDRAAVGFGLIIGFLGCLPGLVSLTHAPQRGLHYLRNTADWIAAHTVPDLRVVVPRVDDRLSLIAYYSRRRYFYWPYTANHIPAQQIKRLCRNQPFVLPLLFQGPGQQAFPRRIGSLEVLKDHGHAVCFRSRHALQGDEVVLYALPGTKVMDHR